MSNGFMIFLNVWGLVFTLPLLILFLTRMIACWNTMGVNLLGQSLGDIDGVVRYYVYSIIAIPVYIWGIFNLIELLGV